MATMPPLLYTDPRTGELRRRRWTLTVIDGVDAGSSCVIEQSPALLGAAPAATLVLTDDTVSRYHLEIDVLAEGLRLRDLESTNGTFVGPTRIRDAFVEPNETFRLGRTVVRATGQDEPGPDVVTDPLGLPIGAVDRIGAALAVSIPMRSLFEDLRKIAESRSAVLLEGDPGSGKATVARALHDLGAHKDGPYVAFLVAPDADAADLDARLFGTPSAEGAWERAAGGSLFIEHVDRLPQALQRKLVRAMELGEYPAPKGDPRRRKLDVRFSASTSTPAARVGLEPRLLRRIGVVRLKVPALEDRKDDLVHLARALVARRGSALSIGPRLTAAIEARAWPGNLDELSSALAALEHAEEWIAPDSPLDPLRSAHLTDAIAFHRGSVTAAARALGSSTPRLFSYAARANVEVDTA